MPAMRTLVELLSVVSIVRCFLVAATLVVMGRIVILRCEVTLRVARTRVLWLCVPTIRLMFLVVSVLV